ncbi:hypothetical protein GQ42DRAFT_180128 [Ramicandelaber brevisporus]|nr:hypothetical protein GQ42DRAFT_180128 [Ramicandelaber brevisporus]
MYRGGNGGSVGNGFIDMADLKSASKFMKGVERAGSVSSQVDVDIGLNDKKGSSKLFGFIGRTKKSVKGGPKRRGSQADLTSAASTSNNSDAMQGRTADEYDPNHTGSSNAGVMMSSPLSSGSPVSITPGIHHQHGNIHLMTSPSVASLTPNVIGQHHHQQQLQYQQHQQQQRYYEGYTAPYASSQYSSHINGYAPSIASTALPTAVATTPAVTSNYYKPDENRLSAVMQNVSIKDGYAGNNNTTSSDWPTNARGQQYAPMSPSRQSFISVDEDGYRGRSKSISSGNSGKSRRTADEKAAEKAKMDEFRRMMLSGGGVGAGGAGGISSFSGTDLALSMKKVKNADSHPRKSVEDPSFNSGNNNNGGGSSSGSGGGGGVFGLFKSKKNKDEKRAQQQQQLQQDAANHSQHPQYPHQYQSINGNNMPQHLINANDGTNYNHNMNNRLSRGSDISIEDDNINNINNNINGISPDTIASVHNNNNNNNNNNGEYAPSPIIDSNGLSVHGGSIDSTVPTLHPSSLNETKEEKARRKKMEKERKAREKQEEKAKKKLLEEQKWEQFMQKENAKYGVGGSGQQKSKQSQSEQQQDGAVLPSNASGYALSVVSGIAPHLAPSISNNNPGHHKSLSIDMTASGSSLPLASQQPTQQHQHQQHQHVPRAAPSLDIMAQQSVESGSHYKNLYAQLKQQPQQQHQQQQPPALHHVPSVQSVPFSPQPPQPTIDPAMAALLGPGAAPSPAASIQPVYPHHQQHVAQLTSSGGAVAASPFSPLTLSAQYPLASSSAAVTAVSQSEVYNAAVAVELAYAAAGNAAGSSQNLAPGIRPPRRRTQGNAVSAMSGSTDLDTQSPGIAPMSRPHIGPGGVRRDPNIATDSAAPLSGLVINTSSTAPVPINSVSSTLSTPIPSLLSPPGSVPATASHTIATYSTAPVPPVRTNPGASAAFQQTVYASQQQQQQQQIMTRSLANMLPGAPQQQPTLTMTPISALPPKSMHQLPAVSTPVPTSAAVSESDDLKEIRAIFPHLPADTLRYYMHMAGGNSLAAVKLCMDDIRLAAISNQS